MPEAPSKTRPHPWKTAPAADGASPAPPRPGPPYAELAVTTNFTFLSGASHPDELVARAAELGYAALGIADANTLAGVVRAHVAAKQADLPLAVGARLTLATGQDAPADDGEPAPAAPAENLEVIVYPTDRAAYGRLCRLLTLGKRRAPKGQCRLSLHDLLEHQAGLLALVVPPERLDEAFVGLLGSLRRVFDDDRLSLLACCPYGPDDRGRLAQLGILSQYARVPLLACNDVRYHDPARRPLQDVLTCIRLGCTVEQAGRRLLANAERHLKSPEEMARLFAAHPRALARSVEVARRAAAFSLDALRYEYPDEICPPGRTAMQHLEDLAWRGAAERYPAGVPEKVARQIRHELGLIDELRYAPYFLTVHDLVHFARSRGILCQGRGAAANSAVCYCLALTSVDPDRVDVLFERFISRERNEPPDIDIDFEHERREEVIQYLYQRYGRHRAALTAEVITYRRRSAVREVGKALGLSLDAVDRLAKSFEWWDGGAVSLEHLQALGFQPDDPLVARLVSLANDLLGFPRHLSQHVGGFVITRGPLSELVPIENAAMADRTVIEWDKDDIDAMGMLKVDILALGMLTCIRKAFELVSRHHRRSLTLATIPPEDPATYDMICQADTVGVFQIESRAQMSMLPRLRPRCYYDLVIEVAIVRPGPILGDMVHPYLRRRNGEEPVTYPDDRVRQVLGKTLGVPLFQEQAMALSIVAAGFTPDEADQLRRAIASKRGQVKLELFGRKLVEGMLRHGYTLEFARKCFQQIQGFSQYGFPESHAASFALLVYASAYLKRHYPAAFAAALLNSQPMGFYAPAQIVRDARSHGVRILPVDVNRSDWDCTLEPAADDAPGAYALRLGMRLVKGLRQAEVEAIVVARAQHGPFASLERLWRAAGVRVESLRRLAAADGFRSLGLDRQAALWRIHALRDAPAPLFEQAGAEPEPAGTDAAERLPPVHEVHRVMHDFVTTGLSLRRHPVAFLRQALQAMHATPNGELADETRWPHGRSVAVAGVCLVRQRPGTAGGILFMTLEDETGIANLVIRPHVYERFRRAARDATILLARGRIERKGQFVHVSVQSLHDLTNRFRGLAVSARNFH